uniref:Major facilitator superfamily (MFS) profile domain-containing protein n=1 Tax=Clastoptera arizonana TaxID=38151 RepID=A0A1B6CRM2_9HEMI
MMKLSKFSKRQILTLVVFSIADFCNAICVSLQAPFYPHEAEKKGATAAEYGLVFGVFELVVFVISPIYGQYLNRIGPKVIFNTGILTTGVCAILFGLLDKVDGHYPFIILSFIIRIVEAMGNAGFLTASFAIIAMEFPENVATTFASLETFFGLGMIVGPTVGGALYQIGGYTTPFAVLGFVLFLAALMTYFVLPDHGDQGEGVTNTASLLEVLKIPGVILASVSIVVTSMSIGFLTATLEPHLRQFGLTPIVLGLMFVINGGVYAITAPCWGWLCDNKISPKIVTLLGCILLFIAFSLIGPAPYLSCPEVGSQERLLMVIAGLVVHGLSIGAQLVASFTDALRTSIQNGFPNNLETYGMISGLWTSTFALGAFIGPSVSGVLYDTIGFNNSTVFIVVLSVIVGGVVSIFLCCSKQAVMYKEIVPETEGIFPGKLDSTHNLHSDHYNSSNGYNMGSNQSLSIAPGMSGMITCNSYKNRLGDFHRKESLSIINPQQYSSSYGSMDPKTSYLESST